MNRAPPGKTMNGGFGALTNTPPGEFGPSPYDDRGSWFTPPVSRDAVSAARAYAWARTKASGDVYTYAHLRDDVANGGLALSGFRVRGYAAGGWRIWGAVRNGA